MWVYMACVTEAQVLGLLRNTLSPDQRTAVEQHLDRCPECLELVTLASQTSLVTRQLALGTGELPRATGDATVIAAGTKVGRYEIVEPLGRGGMGMVYVARDDKLGRRVAIKLVNPSFAHHEHSQLGLLREAQAMARITQPNVLTVYDMGMFDDAVFLAAELVDGDTLDVWLAEPRRWRQIVEVFVQAARGLEAAHVAGLVHRDFKPSNVLVGRDGRVRVFDFGVVRFVDTVAAGRELAGTPLYMSPEQQQGEVVDARSDQYSFCVALHEALFGALPTPRAQASAAPRAADRTPGWLREIVQRGLARDPAKRFASMRELIAAIERGLGRRRRWLLAGVSGLAVSAAVATAVLGYTRGRHEQAVGCRDRSLDRIWDGSRKAQVIAAVLGTGAVYAPTALPRIQGVLDQFAVRWASEQRGVCLASGDRASEVRASEERVLHDRRRACLDRQRMVFEAIVDRFATADRTAVNQANQLLGALPSADECARPMGAEWPANPGDRVRLTQHFQELARLASLASAGQVAEAERGVPALVRDAGALGSRSAEADAGYLAGHVAGLAGRYDEAVRRIAQAMWTAQAARHDELVVTAACELIDIVSRRQRRPADARQYVELARASAERVGSGTARAAAARAIGVLETEAGQYDAAEQELRRALALTEARVPPDPVEVAQLLRDLFNLEFRRGRFTAAEPLIRRALGILERELGPLHPTYAQGLNNLGNLFAEQQHYGESAATYDRAIALLEHAFGPDHPDIAKVLGNSAGVRVENGDLPGARAQLERAIAIHQRTDASSPILASSFNNLAEFQRIQGDLAAAGRNLERALEIRRKRLGEHHPETTQSLLGLYGNAYLRGDLATAARWCTAARASEAGSDARNLAVRATVEMCQGDIALARGQRDVALAIFERALVTHSSGGEDPIRLANTQFAVARALPTSAATRALELARKARASYGVSPTYFARELGEIDAWLRARTR